MYGGQQQIGPMSNNIAIKILWTSFVCYGLGLVLPQITSDGDFITFNAWDLLTDLGLLFIIGSIGLTYKAVTMAKKFLGSKKFGISASILVMLPIFAISSELNNLNVVSESVFGVELFTYGIGYYLLWIGAILSTVGSVKAQSTPQYGYTRYQQPQYQQYGQQPNYQQQSNYQQPPVQPPSYIEPEQSTMDPLPYINSNQPSENINELPSEKREFCGNCGYQNDFGVKFCVNCGQRQE